MTAIEFDSVSKLYRLGVVGTGALTHDVHRWWVTKVLRRPDPYLKIGETNDRSKKGDSQYVWALRDIDFKVEQGDIVGIIGKNGAGKSTLLKLLSRVTAPTTGSIRARGRIASLLEVGTGFHPELTGRENIYMNGTIMGMTRAEIDAKLDAIVDFAGVERYLDTPVKRYSSGMTVRLGFAVAAFLEPDILVVDEVLAVGDAEFQKKAVGKMQDVASAGGRTVLFVSHNMGAVRSLCKRGIVLDQGQIIYDAPVEAAIDKYMNATSSVEETASKIKDTIIWTKDYLKIIDVKINGSDSRTTKIEHNQEVLEVEIEFETAIDLRCELKIIFKSTTNVALASYIEGRYKGNIYDFKIGRHKITKRIKLPKYLTRGVYLMDIYIQEPFVQDFCCFSNCCRLETEGSCDEFTRPTDNIYEGFCGLEPAVDDVIV